MNKLFSLELHKEKLAIKNRYLAGETVPSIARSYSVTERNIYYHLGKLSPDDKGLHIKNMDLRKMAGESLAKDMEKQITCIDPDKSFDGKEEENVPEQAKSEESPAQGVEGGLADFK